MALCYANMLYLKMVFLGLDWTGIEYARKLDFRKLFLLSQFQSPFKGFQSNPRDICFCKLKK